MFGVFRCVFMSQLADYCYTLLTDDAIKKVINSNWACLYFDLLTHFEFGTLDAAVFVFM